MPRQTFQLRLSCSHALQSRLRIFSTRWRTLLPGSGTTREQRTRNSILTCTWFSPLSLPNIPGTQQYLLPRWAQEKPLQSLHVLLIICEYVQQAASQRYGGEMQHDHAVISLLHPLLQQFAFVYFLKPFGITPKTAWEWRAKSATPRASSP